MNAWFAYAFASIYVLYQALPLLLAFRGRIRGWFFAQSALGLAMLALADLQYNGRSSALLLTAMVVTILVNTALSALLAFTGFQLRGSRPQTAIQEVL